MRRPTPLSVLVLAVLSCLPSLALRAQGTAIGFPEQFALAADRHQLLAQLIPGSEDYYFYSCLERQQAGAFGEVPALLRAWIQRYGRTARVEEIENRQALLAFARDPAATYAFLRQRLGARFDAERQSLGAVPDLPTQLDPETLSPARLLQRALAQHPGSLAGIRDAALPMVAATELDDALLMNLLQRLQRPDLPNLPALIVRNLQDRHSGGFGSLPIHQNLLLSQLEELVRLQPALLNQTAFVEVYLRRLQPSADVQWQRDPAARLAYLQRLWAFAQRLSPAHNSLKAHVLYRWLWHDLKVGTPDKQRFLAYLRLPRQTGYVNPEYLRRRPRGDELVNAAQQFPTELEVIGDDEPLVRSYLQHFFASEDGYQEYVEYVQEAWLKRLFAETKILLGLGDMEHWYAMLDPGYVEQLKQRVEIAFPPTQPEYFGAQAAVGIDVDVKNVPKLLVKVFAIDSFDYERETGKEVDASIDLDGMVANAEQSYGYDDNPLRRVRRHFDFPALSQPGTYVVEFLGNGLSSRAVIKKGRLQYVARTGAAGQVLTVLDENGEVVTDAAAWCGGQQYAADDDGSIYVPFAPQQVMQPLILRHGRLTSLHSFLHLAEHYRLDAEVYAEREALLAPFRARILVRPMLLVHGAQIDLSLLQQPELQITARDLDGIDSTQTVRDLKPTADAELVHEIAVPERLQSLTVSLRGRIRSLSQGQDVELASSPVELSMNRIEHTEDTHCPLLGRNTAGYFLDVRGKNGEPRAQVAVHLSLQHRDFTDSIEVDLKTDAKGRILLGRLPGITALRTPAVDGGIWQLREADCNYASVLTGVVGSTLRVPYFGKAARADRSAVSLLELLGGAFARDAFDSVAIQGGFVELRQLPAGDYDLWLKEADVHIAVRVTAGKVHAGWAIGDDRALQISGQEPLQITGLSIAGDELQVRLANANAATRVHVMATRYLEAFDPFLFLLAPAAPSGGIEPVAHAQSLYYAGREISDEYRYILERRYQRKFPGNMLHRPGLILNPWQLDQSQTATGLQGGAGGRFDRRAGGRGGAPASPAPAETRPAGFDPGRYANLDFLPQPASVLVNLRPDAQGVVHVKLADLGQGQLVHAIALDPHDTVYATLALQEQPLQPRSQTLAGGLDPGKHFTEQRRIEFVQAGGQDTIEDITTTKLETYDSLAKVFGLLRTLSGNAELDQFAFLMQWPSLADADKLQQYSQHACHELHFFLAQKDPKFFAAVIRPYLANKADKTFLDHWLLQDDLSGYLQPWAFARLNIVEQILLTRRLQGQRDAGARHVQELFAIKPVDQAVLARLFSTALAGRALETEHLLLDDQAAAYRLHEQSPGTLRQQAQQELAKEKAAANEPAAAAERAATGSDEFFLGSTKKDAERRADVRELYRPPGRTFEYAENNYWHAKISEQDASLIEVDGFWRDFAVAPADQPFCSSHIGEAASNLHEMLMALSVLDLPFTGKAPVTERTGNRVQLTASTPLLLVKKEVLPAAAGTDESPILISQDFYRLDARYRFDGNDRLDNFVNGEFLVDVAYGCQVVLTNPTSSLRKLDVLLQIPRGAIPVKNGFYTRGLSLQLQPYATTSLEYSFYFPAPGDYVQFPAHVSKEGTLVAFAPARTLHVVATPTELDTTSWQHVSQDGSTEEVLRYLDEHNLERLDLTKIAWRLRDAGFFQAVLGKLRQRLFYLDQLWSYGLLHGDEAAVRQYLRHQDQFVVRCGPTLDSPLLQIDPIARRFYQRIEFEPLFHARAHQFGRQRVILNSDLAQQYLTFLQILDYRPKLDSDDWMDVTYYLLLQDRIAEGLAAFAQVDAGALATRLQYDYMRCYLDFFTDDHRLARGIAEPYRNYPVQRWQQMFQDVLNQLDEAEGKPSTASNPDDRTQRQTELAASEPGLELQVEAGTVTLRYQNLQQCRVSYYKLDVEFSFSTNPFVQQGSGAFAYIEPNRSDVVALPPGQKQLQLPLPSEYQKSNVMIEVEAAGITRRQTYLSNTLSVQLIEGYGQLQVTEAGTGKQLPKVYVKVYARLGNGSVRFHKDGYTDLRGRFDYASVSESGTEGAERFAILVLSDADGALIREVAPPGR